MENLVLALAGNPNSGKTTMFNALTGAIQFVGNWPGVTVEKKEGKYKKDKNISIMDLPGIYSLSPYSQEEVVAREYLVNERPDAIINIVDATNLERNLYLTTQLLEVGIPVVIALNMMDLVKKNGDEIHTDVLSKILRCPVIETSALKEDNIDQVVQAAVNAAKKGDVPACVPFDKQTEDWLAQIQEQLPADVPQVQKRYLSIKLFEKDTKIPYGNAGTARIIEEAEAVLDDDTESHITSVRYDYITGIINKVRKKQHGKESMSDRIDRIVTNRWLGLPIFALVMFVVYYISVTTVGSWVTDWTNDVFVGEWIQAPVEAFLTNVGCADWLTGLICEGIIGGVGAMLGFMPQMFILFFFLAILEDCGYMARIAFVMDRVFRKFGLSGKSFIPMLIGTGCGLPGIMAARTIENEKDRRLTIMTVTFMPCGAKLPLIACIAGALFGNSGLVAFSAYVLGVVSVIVTGVMLKKTKLFAGDVTPFVMELPAYHFPTVKNVWHSIWDRLKAFAKRAVTVYMLAAILVWFLSSFGWTNGAFGMVDDLEQSICYYIGNAIAWIFTPCGFDKWQAVIASILGLAAKEEVVGVLGQFAAMSDALDVVESGGSLAPIAALLGNSALVGYSFLAFNLLCAPCFAAINTIRVEMQNGKLAAFAIAYQCVFAYAVSLMIYQFGSLFTGGGFTAGTVAAILVLVFILFMLFRPGYKPANDKKSVLSNAAK
ncbi:MAG: ferrous iron transport protein B [Oscillospiraceae bacterium]|nr:ferrous iron transport protein B [Oscillospiraceae bacterium]